MKLPGKLKKQTEVNIADYYAINVGSIWRGLKQESAAFWWLCIYIFFEYIRPQSLYPVIDFLPWAQLSLIMAVISAFFDQNVKWVKSPGNALFILFFLIVILSSIFAFQPSAAWDKIDIIINWVVVYFLIVTIVNTEKRFLIFILLFLLVNFKMSQHGFFSFAARGFTYTKWGVVGSPGWFRNAGDFGIEMLLFIPLAVAFILSLRSYWGRFKRLFFYFIPITGLVAIIGTSSRGAQLGLLGIGLYLFLKNLKNIKWLALFIIMGWGLYAVLPEKMLEEYQTAGEDKTSQDRLAHWRFGMDVVGDHPGLGVGYENWLTYCNYMNPDGLGARPWCRLPHNTYITAAAETGITGFVVYVILIIFIFVQNSRSRACLKKCDNKFLQYISYGIDAGLVGYLIATIFFTVLFYPIFWVQLAMTVALHEVSKKKLGLKRGD